MTDWGEDFERRAGARRAAAAAGEIAPEDVWLYHWADGAFAFEKGWTPGTRIGVAVSGGSDSMATLALLARFHPVEAVTVDHGLRSESADEAVAVSQVCTTLGVPHTTLRWSGPEATGNLMDQARRARLSLIADWARGRGIGLVALGHTADDQAETFLMRLARASGPEGLAGMRERFEVAGVTFVRPFLGQTRSELRAYLTRHCISWIEDPSNDNTRFERVKARRALRALKPLGITVERLNETIHHLAMAEGALGFALRRLVDAHVTTPAGDVVIDARAFQREIDPEMKRRLLNGGLRWVAGAEHAPRAAKVTDFLGDWRARRDRTLHGCRIISTDTEIRITREARAVAGLTAPVGAQWDRWRLTPPEGLDTTGMEISALGPAGLKTVKDWRASGAPRVSLLASPAVRAGDRLISAPLAGFANGWKAEIACGSFHNALIRR